jgi:RHS repeat-associated protein
MSSEENFQMPESRLHTTETEFLMIESIKAKTIILTLLLMFFWLAQSAFAVVAPKAGVPGEYQGSTAAGSYPLSNLDNINYFNGNLGFNLPLVTLGGRGEATFTMMLTTGQSNWSFDVVSDPPICGGFPTVCSYRYWYNPVPYNRQAIKADLSPGVLAAIHTGEGVSSGCSNGGNGRYFQRLTTLTFAMPGGSSVELRDRQTDGKPAGVNQCETSEGPSRGTIFDSPDGSGITFVSDTEVVDSSTPTEMTTLSGMMYFKNGVRYRFDYGNVTRITDRNGNWISFATVNGVYTATDSLGRQVTIQLSNDQRVRTITMVRPGTASKTIKIYKNDGPSIIRSDLPPLTYNEGFPRLQGRQQYGGAIMSPFNISRVELPDGRSYQFKYNQYSELARVELPTGGAMEYDWTGDSQPGINSSTDPSGWGYGYIHRYLTEKRTYDNGATGQAYTSKMTTSIAENGNDSSVTVKEYVGGITEAIARTDHFYYGSALKSIQSSSPIYGIGSRWNTGREYQTNVYVGDGAQLLRQSTQTWQPRIFTNWTNSTYPQQGKDPRLLETVTTLADSGQVSKTSAINPNTGAIGFDQYNNQTDVYEYDFGANAVGDLKRHSHTDFIIGSNYTDSPGTSLRSLPLQTWVSPDANGTTKASLTQFEYDNYTPEGGANPKHALLEPRSNTIGHDTANYGTNKTIRGNVTKATTYGNASNQSEPISSYANYDILGNVVKTWDAMNHSTMIDYTDRFGAPDNEVRSNTAPTQLGGQSTFAFPTSVTNTIPFQWTTFTQFDYFTGAAVNTEDINGVISKTIYNDLLDRPTQSVSAIGTAFEQQSNIIYDDSNHRVETKSDLNALNDNLLKSESFYDGLGRTIESRSYEADGNFIASKSIPFVMVTDPETGILRVGTKSSNPYRPNAGEQPVWTTSLSDALGRSIKTITPDGAIAKTDYSGNTVTVTDQAGKKRRSVTNALGQLMRVDEPNDAGLLDLNNAPVQSTNYSYDTLNNLTTVSQGVQTRSFVYDSLSRLKQATNPESGLIQYSYDNNGNLTQKTDARNVQTAYLYDNLNRVTARNYSAPANLPNYQITPNVVYTYDDSTVAFAKGKLTKVSSSLSETRYTQFDNIGRILTSQQMTDGQTYSSSYVYNLSGALIEETYPSGRVVKNTLSNDGNLSQVQSKKTNDTFRNYANSFNYTAAGAVSSVRLGNGRWENTQFNSRLQPIQIGLGSSATSQNLLKLNFDYGGTDNNGNVKSQTITVPTIGANTGFTAIQNYTYDSLNRLKSAVENINGNQTPSWKQTFTFDRYGNRRFDEANTTTLAPGCQTAVCNPTIDPATNKLIGYQFDNSGNTKVDANNQTFVYDAENKQVEVKNSSNQTVGQYFYDGDGKRIKKVVPATQETTIFVYDASGKMVAEYSTQVASQQDAKVSYLTSDHLGSPRINTDANGQVIARHDYQPFGEEISRASYGADAVRKKFTGYERDNETELDYAQARMYANKLGRFTTTDPLYVEFGRLRYPQAWNLFAYSRNNPLKFVDPSGLDVKVNCKTTKEKTQACQDETTTDLNNRKDAQFKVEIKNGKFSVVGKVDVSKLSKSEKKLYSAITDTYAHSTLNVELSSDKITFGRADAAGENSIDLSDLSKLNASGNSTLAGEVIAHETVEGSESSLDTMDEEDAGKSYQDTGQFKRSHATANQYFGDVSITLPDASGLAGARVSSRDALYNFGRIGSVSVTKKFNSPIPIASITSANFPNLVGDIDKAVAPKPPAQIPVKPKE